MMRRIIFTAGSAAFAITAFSAGAWATLAMQKKANDLGFEVKDCLYCHNEKLPKKDAVTNNARGQWLVDRQKAREAKEIDISWLKDFVEKSTATEKK
ncbi:MAG: hypothetical protein JXO72_15495 [Vicinamibacteria bacterium]|nr:hypothetical protein [Vicinamibacteria bacterium]